MDQELILIRVDGRDTGMVPLEVEIRRSDDALKLLDRSPGRRRCRGSTHAAPGLLFGCPLAQDAGRRPEHLRGIRLCGLQAGCFRFHRERVGLGLEKTSGDQPSSGSQHRAS